MISANEGGGGQDGQKESEGRKWGRTVVDLGLKTKDLLHDTAVLRRGGVRAGGDDLALGELGVGSTVTRRSAPLNGRRGGRERETTNEVASDLVVLFRRELRRKLLQDVLLLAIRVLDEELDSVLELCR